MRSLRLLHVVMLCSWPVLAAEAEPGTTPATWKAHVKQVAARKKLAICSWGQLRYRHQGKSPGFFAVVVGGGKGAERTEAVMLGRGRFERWREADDTYSLDGACDVGGATPPANDPDWTDLDVMSSYFDDRPSYRYMQDNETFIDGELVRLGDRSGDVDQTEETNWVEAVRRSQARDQGGGGEDEAPSEEQRHGLVVVLPPGSPWLPRWRTPTFVSFGAKYRKARGDADLVVKATEPSPETVTIQIDVKDDRLVPVAPGADDKQFLRGDHVELWWHHRGTPTETEGNRQLGVGLLADGTADVRWLIMPQDAARDLPIVRRTGAHLEVDLPVARVAVRDGAAAAWSAPFTVAFSDADDPKAGQQTVVATSTLRWNKEDTFGELARFDSTCRRFPSF